MLTFISLMGQLAPPKTSLWGWWSAENSFSDTALTTPQTTDGGTVGGLKDLTGNGRNFTQGTGTQQPLYKTNRLNGKPSILFDGSNDIMQTASVPGAQPMSTYMVHKISGAGNQALYIMVNVGSTNAPALGWRSGEYEMDAATWASCVDTNITGFKQTASIINGASSKFVLDAGTVRTVNPGTTASVGGITIGGGVTTEFLQGEILEMLTYNVAHDPASGDGLLVRQYLNTKYGMGLSL